MHPNKHTMLNLARTALFQAWQAVCNKHTLVFTDEVGFKGTDGERRYARAPRGQPAHGVDSRGGDTRLNYLVAMGWHGVLPCTYGHVGSCNAALFDTWVWQMLIPTQLALYGARTRRVAPPSPAADAPRSGPGSTLVLDNWSGYNKLRLRAMFAAAGLFIAFLPGESCSCAPCGGPMRHADAARAQCTRRSTCPTSCCTRG